jgi:hypothetical protein
VTASYPVTVKSFSTKVDFTDTILAEHVNSLQDEVNVIEANLGTYIRTGSGWVGSFDQITSSWNTLKDRIANIEYGLYTAYNEHTSINGGSTIQSAATGTTSLIIKAKASQTADLLDFQLSDGTVVSKIDASGNMYTSGQQVVPVVYSSSQPSSVPTGTIWIDSTSNVAILTAQSGVPSGGTTGQSLVKSSNSDYAVTWSSDIVGNAATATKLASAVTINGTSFDGSGSITVAAAAGTLTGSTLASGVTSSSLTSVGTLSSLSVTNAVTAGSFSGDATNLTNIKSSSDGILILMGAL